MSPACPDPPSANATEPAGILHSMLDTRARVLTKLGRAQR
jgi:hypothetical protein